MERMLGGFFSKPGTDLPNAALSLETRDGAQILVGVELLDGRYNRDRRVAHYRLRSLKQHGDQPLRLPRTFGDSSVFIDTIYNTCKVIVVGAMPTLTLTSSDKASHDDWDDDWGGAPPATLAGNEGLYAAMYGTESGFARGCWNNVTYADGNGSVEISVSDPYSGSNTYSCTGTGNYVCTGPWDFPWGGYGSGDFTNTGGDTVSVIYSICTKDNPDCWSRRGLVRLGTAGP